MKTAPPLLVALFLLLLLSASPGDQATDLGFREDTKIIESHEDGDFCPGTLLLMTDDGDFENGYCWRFAGVIPPDYGSWAECHESDFICGVQFLLTQTGYYIGQTMDVYVWESAADGNPPPGPDPGNIICVLTNVEPGAIAFWPDISAHNVKVCCETGGSHFVGYWPNWSMEGCGWFIASDEDGPGEGCPRTKIAPGIGYPTGWSHPNIVGTFGGCKDLGIRVFSGSGDCPPTPSRPSTWGRIKALY
jgi:hypothetical protein